MANTARKSALAAGIIAGLALSATAAQSQSGVAAPITTSVGGPAVGDLAPDFTASGATRYGVLRNPVRLSDFRGHTVVLAFFVKARTKG
jgi:hypothetical protein